MPSRRMKKQHTMKLKVALKALWKKHIGPNPPEGVNHLARCLCEKLDIEIVPGKKMAYLVLNAVGSNPDLVPKPGAVSASSKRYAKTSSSKQDKAQFYKSWDWRTLRMKVLQEFGQRCMCCGATPDHKDMTGAPVKIVVDHIKPLHTHWELRLNRDNLQVLCDECNQGKGAWDQTDYRPKPSPDEWIYEDDGIPQMLREQLKYTH